MSKRFRTIFIIVGLSIVITEIVLCFRSIYTEETYSFRDTIPPRSSSDTGVVGQIKITPSGYYVCIAKNTWVKAVFHTLK